MKKFKTKEELLQDSINYYWGKPERRCLKEGSNHSCQYAPSETSLGCAIGRVIPIKLAKELDIKSNGVATDTVFNKLPKWLQGFGQNFLIKLQTLHDSSYFSNSDEKRINLVMREFVDMTKITFPEN